MFVMIMVSQYYTLLVFLTLILFVLGGFCFVLTDTAVRYVEATFDSLLLDLDASRRASITLSSVIVDLRLYLYVSGGVSWLMVILLLIVMSNVVRLVTPAKAFSVLLQATNLAIVPLGIALIAAGLYVADTAATVEAPFAAFAVFLMGFLVVFFAVVGCVGVTIDSRGIIRLYQVLIGILGLLFLAFGVAALAIAETVLTQLVSRWDTIRKVLPPSFSGKYDLGQFEAFVETNLKAVGFMAVCAGVILLVQLWAASRLRGELKRMNEVENRVDELFARLANVVGDLQEAEKAHRVARKELQRAGTARAAINVLAATMAEECQTEFEQMADRLEAAAEAEEWDEEDMDKQLAELPRKWAREDVQFRALRRAEWDKVRLLARKVALEEEIGTLDSSLIEDQGAGGVAEAQKRMSVKSVDSAAGASTPGGSEAHDVLDKFSVPKRRERPMNAGALFWKRWWTKGTRGSRRAVMCCCCCFSFVIVIVLAFASASLYFATSCATLASVAKDKSYPDLQSQQFWLDTAVRRGAIGIQPGAVTAPSLVIHKSAFQEGMISDTFPEVTADTAAAGSTDPPRPGIGVSISEPPPTRVLSFDVACQTADATFVVPQRSSSGTTASGSSAGGSGAGSSAGAPPASSRRALAQLPLAARERGEQTRRVLTSRLVSPMRQRSEAAARQLERAHTGREAQSAAGQSALSQANNAERAQTTPGVTQATPGAWLPLALVSAVVDAIESATAAAAADGTAVTVAPAGSPSLRARLLGNLATASMDWSGTAPEARPFTGFIGVDAVASAELTGVFVGGGGALMTTELGDVSIASGAAVCDSAQLGSGTGGLRFSTDKGTASILDSVVYNCDVVLSGEASLVRIINSVLMNENGGSNAILRGSKGSLLVERVNAERLSLQGREGSARVLSTEVRESLKIATTVGNVQITDLVTGPRAVVQIETGEGAVTIHAKQFRGIVSIVTSGSVTCDGGGFEKRYTADGSTEIDPCTGGATASSGLTFVEEARVNCVTASNRNDCAYLGEVTVVSNSGNVRLTFDKFPA